MRTDARLIYDAAIAAVQSEYLIPKYLHTEGDYLFAGQVRYDLRKFTGIKVIAAGKAAASMAAATENILKGRINGGLVLTKYEHCLPLKRLDCIEAGHPVPDENGRKAAAAIAEIAKNAKENELIIFLLSGGASALMADLSDDIDAKEFSDLTKKLLNSGATISELNAIRKHLSFLKGGQLAGLAWPATIISLVLSDVPGDSPDTIGSGPTVPDTSGFNDALQIIEKYNLWSTTGDSVLRRLIKGAEGKIPETPKPGTGIFSHTQYEMIGTSRTALEAASRKAGSLGYQVIIFEKQMEGEAKQQASALLAAIKNDKRPLPLCMLAGGETTVTVKGNGKGGRNQELALAAAVRMLGSENEFQDVLLLAAATDGTDGPTDAAGAFADRDLTRFIIENNINPVEWLNNNDAYGFFSNTDAHLITGATQTNVMDIAILLRT